MSVQTNTQWLDACAAALTELPGMGPARLAALLLDLPPDSAWRLVASGSSLPVAVASTDRDISRLQESWRAVASRTDPLDVLEKYRRRGVQVWTRFTRYPDRLTGDNDAPAILFTQGDEAAMRLPSVAIVGTRRCTYEGRAIARRFGVELAEAGVSIVSGLALGVDGAAHRGALEAACGAPPIAVVGNGLDIDYPKRHADLWAGIRERGLLVSESPLGATPEPWRFPARNRIIAGLADLLLVVESHDRGGSLITVDEALQRDVPVMAVPGSIRNPAAKGTNQLLMDAATPACSTDDVLRELSWQIDTGGPGDGADVDVDVEGSVVTSTTAIRLAGLDPLDAQVYEAIDHTYTPMDEVVARTGLLIAQVATVLVRLTTRGIVVGEAGCWRRVGPGEEAAD